MRIDPLGDSAHLLRDLDQPAFEVAEAIELARLPGVLEAVASYDTVAVYVDPAHFKANSLKGVQSVKRQSLARLHEIPVCYELGEDLELAASSLGLLADNLISLHQAEVYRCFAVGFCPGFPYLGYLPQSLCGVSRRTSPRVRIVPGAVAITGRQTGIYPLERPGGWAIIGRTPLCIVDPDSGYFPIMAGDQVRFVSIGATDYDSLKGQRL
jgi:inhibitor of KinA